MKANILEHVNGVGHGGFLQDVSITFPKNTDKENPLRVT